MLNLLQLPDDYAFSIFISNLKPDISRHVHLFYPKTLTHALNLAKQLEVLIFNTLRRPFVPYRNPQMMTPNQIITQPLSRSESFPSMNSTRNPFFQSQGQRYSNSNFPVKPVSNRPEVSNAKTGKTTTREKKEEKRRKVLCMWCGAKFVSGHR